MDESISRFITEEQEKIDKKVTKGLVPFHISIDLKKINEKVAAIKDSVQKTEFIVKEAKRLNETTPPWFWASASGENILYGFEHDKMGDIIINNYHLVRYPKLLEGAVYEPKRGAWRYFGKNEMLSFSDKETLATLQLWGFYESKFIGLVSRYVKQKTYDASYPSATPFEESKPELIVFKNGTYNILTGKMKKHNYHDFILNSFNYDLDITGTPTPHTDKFFNDFFDEGALFMKQFIGYTFYRSHSPAQDLVFLYGEGGEGKSSFLTMMTDLYTTKENRTAITPQELANDKFAVVELLGKTLNVSGDIDDDYISQTGILKRLTGGDTVKGEYKGIQGFSFINYAKNIFSMNDFFHFKDLSKGFADRLTVVPIKIGNQRAEGATFWKEHDLAAIREEASAFVYQCLQEFRKVFDGKRAIFTKSQDMQDIKQAWLFDNDRIGQFLFEGCEIHIGDLRGEIASTVYKEFKAFCSQNGYIAKSAQELNKYLLKENIPKRKGRKGFKDGGSNSWRYIGLELKVTFLPPFESVP